MSLQTRSVDRQGTEQGCWRSGDQEIRRSGDQEIRRSGDQEIRRLPGEAPDEGVSLLQPAVRDQGYADRKASQVLIQLGLQRDE